MQVWYADDAAAMGKIADLCVWWDKISHLGPSYWYNANALNTWLVTKADFQSETVAIKFLEMQKCRSLRKEDHILVNRWVTQPL